MMTMKALVLTTVALVLAASGPVAAGTLIGTQVSGALYFEGYMPNYFDPVNGLVPTGYLNTSGSTVTISSNAVEFGFADGTTTITAEFTSSQLIIADQPKSTAHYNPLQLVFTNAAFTDIAEVSDTFPDGGLTGSLSGSVITLNWGGGSLTGGQPVQAVFNVNVPPSPRLSIRLTSTNTLVLSWPASSTGFNLQQNSSLTSNNWMTITNTPAVINGRNEVILPAPLGTQFHRLKYP